MQQTPPTTERIILIPEILTRAGLSRASIHRLAKSGKFPAPRQISEHRIGWLDSGGRRLVAQPRDASSLSLNTGIYGSEELIVSAQR